MNPDSRPLGLTAMSGFFVFGTIMASLACLALLFPASGLSAIWRLNPEAHAGFQQMGSWAVVLMFVVAIACGLSAYGLWNRIWWGHRMAVALLIVNMVGDAGNAAFRGDLRTLIGLPIAAAMIAYLLTPAIRKQFSRAIRQNDPH